MKKLITTLFLFTLGVTYTSVLHAQQSSFDRATEQLEQQNFQEAISQYRQITNNGYESGALYFNKGIAYSQLDSLGLAKYYFLKSSLFPETKEESQQAVDYLNERFSRRSATLPPLPWEQLTNYLKNQIGVSSLFSMALIFLYLGIIGVLLFWFYSKFSSYSYYIGISAFTMSLLLFITAFYIQHHENRYATGIVIDRQSVVYQLPDRSSAEISTAYEGYTLRIDNRVSEEYQDWIYIRLENGMKGWIDNQAVKSM